MIFVTVGHFSSFDRMVKVVDDWAGLRGRRDVFAQIGETAWRPRHVQWVQFLDSRQYDQKLKEADVVISHAGMGTIFKALECGKPIVVLPKLMKLREIPSEHQLFTARNFHDAGLITMVKDEAELAAKLDALSSLPVPKRISGAASAELLDAIRNFIR